MSYPHFRAHRLESLPLLCTRSWHVVGQICRLTFKKTVPCFVAFRPLLPRRGLSFLWHGINTLEFTGWRHETDKRCSSSLDGRAKLRNQPILPEQFNTNARSSPITQSMNPVNRYVMWHSNKSKLSRKLLDLAGWQWRKTTQLNPSSRH